MTPEDDREKQKIPLEELLSSKGRVKILKELALSDELNISELCRRVSLNHSTTKGHLEALMEAGIVEEKKFGRIKIYRFKSEDLRARSFQNFLDIWES